MAISSEAKLMAWTRQPSSTFRKSGGVAARSSWQAPSAIASRSVTWVGGLPGDGNC